MQPEQQHSVTEAQRPRSSSGLTESDVDIDISERDVAARAPGPHSETLPYSLSTSKSMEESRTSEESTMLGLDFV